MNKKFVIYLHKNLINNKIYIGQTCQNVKTRWKNGNGYKKQSDFYKDICKYGWDNFSHEILFSNLSQEEATKIEIELIEQYNARDPRYGYNKLRGGSNLAGENNPMYGKHHSQETKNKLSNMAKNWSDETHKKMSNSAKERVKRLGPPFQGKHLSEKAKEKLRQVDKSYTQTEEYRKKMSIAKSGGKNGQAIKVKGINALDNSIIYFDCKKDALTFLKLSRSSSKFLNKAIKEHTLYHGYYWEEN